MRWSQLQHHGFRMVKKSKPEPVVSSEKDAVFQAQIGPGQDLLFELGVLERQCGHRHPQQSEGEEVGGSMSEEEPLAMFGDNSGRLGFLGSQKVLGAFLLSYRSWVGSRHSPVSWELVGHFMRLLVA